MTACPRLSSGRPAAVRVIGAMQLTVTGKQTEIGAALRHHVEASLGAILGKYFKTAIEAHAAASDAYAAFDAAAERLAKQLRRYKRRLRDHHAKGREPAGASERAMDYVLAPIGDDEGVEGADAETDGVNGAPAVIAEMITELPSLTVG